jgi:hypothetical protein
MKPTPGICSYCRVTDEQVDGNKLSWHDATRTCCSKYACVKAHHKAARISAAKPKTRFAELASLGWERGAIRLQLDREERQRRRARGKGKAA